MDRVQELRSLAEQLVGVPASLHDYQWDGVAFLCRSTMALLADEMGLGKTVQTAVALALVFKAEDEIRRALIVAPASLTMNWESELAKWAPSLVVRRVTGAVQDREANYQLPIPVLVSSYEQIRKDGLDRIPADTFDIVILDEAQRIKNLNSLTSVACRILSRKRAWALSATPLENSAQDLESILRFLDPLLPADLSGQQLQRHLESVMLRRRKKEVRGELPPVIIQELRLELAHRQRTRYDQAWSRRHDDAAVGPEEVGAVLLGMITRLKIICNHDIESGSSCKLQALREICDSAGQEARILVFSQYVRTLLWIADRIELRHDLVTGSMSMAERNEAMHRFRTEAGPRVLLVSLRAGGVGLNLEEATHVVMFDRWWNPAVEMQAVYRAHRFSRGTPLHVVRFTVVDSIEERIALILNSKEKMFREIVDSAETKAKGFSVREMLQILELSAANLSLQDS
ncbi:MAG: DEAD/DEAH box helicase [Bacteroidota bacterium]|nr:DEAD/DEAH box helicase [Bacteroidota bacterium]